MSLLSRKELLILCLESNFNSTFLYKNYRVSVFFQQFYGNKQLIPLFPCQLFFFPIPFLGYLKRSPEFSLVETALDLLEVI